MHQRLANEFLLRTFPACDWRDCCQPAAKKCTGCVLRVSWAFKEELAWYEYDLTECNGGWAGVRDRTGLLVHED